MKSNLVIIFNFIFRNIPIHIINMITALLPNHLVINRLRGFLIRPFLGSSGKRLQVGRGVIINSPENLFIGDDCYISHYCYIQAKGKVTLKDNVIIGPMSVVASSNHAKNNDIVLNKGENKPIVIGKGTWCGGNVVIIAGVNIGKSVIVGAGAVVSKNVNNYMTVGGVPAKQIK